MQSDSLREAIERKSLTALTKAISKLADELAYHLKPPYTEIIEFKAKEEDERYNVHFSAISRLSYTSMKTQDEGLVFVIYFDGDALSEVPTPPIHELFYAAVIKAVAVYGYGDNWAGKQIPTPVELEQSLDLHVPNINMIKFEDFCMQMQSRYLRDRMHSGVNDSQ